MLVLFYFIFPFLAARETDKWAIQTAGVTLPVQLQPDSGTVDTVLRNTEEFERLNAAEDIP